MSRIRLAKEIAEQTGKSVTDALRYIREVGPRKARASLRTAKEGGKRYWKPTAIVGGVYGGAYYWREQNIRKAEHLAETAESDQEALESLIDSDLPPEAKRDLIDQWVDEGVSDSGDDDGPLDGLLDGLMDDVVTMVVVVMVVGAILNYALSQTSVGPNPVNVGGAST